MLSRFFSSCISTYNSKYNVYVFYTFIYSVRIYDVNHSTAKTCDN